MKVILQQDVKCHGKKGQMVEVSDGYARNFLLPKKLAIPATAENVNTMKQQEGLTVKVSAKAGEGGRLFGAVTAKEISEALNAQHGLNIAKTKIVLDEPIKSCGGYQLKCKLGYEITGTVNVVVTEA